uniref:NADH-ubiquinone oxidoreductase chain 4 n=1 Tax=Asymmetron inferum TaxID=426587 RepID=A7X7C5_9BRAN|nr:NADH dehydrogenase subunit 4 [Asymmetron inferum]BAF76604.1 NADH dehydrogenase subunit 4 [Asymmetron inferum]
MYNIILAYVGLALSVLMCSNKILWRISQFSSLVLIFPVVSLTIMEYSSTSVNSALSADFMAVGLASLSAWLLPLMLMASQQHVNAEPMIYQRVFIFSQAVLTGALILAFLSSDLLLFYIAFEITLLPTLMLITRWGAQKERYQAGTYFMFYTLVGSLPLLICLIGQYQHSGTLCLDIFYLNPPEFNYTINFWWLGCIIAFLVKLPLYGSHLWLPKAHVEAPIAGSMVLAGVLLKLGGYGMMRVSHLWGPMNTLSSEFILGFGLWGMISVGIICLRQTDLKSLIAYSSVGHMALVAAGILSGSTWGYMGALILMIAHGIVSSCLFCLANCWYERGHTRNLIGSRGALMMFPLLTTAWLTSSLMNLALPPSINLFGELMAMVATYTWSTFSLSLMVISTVLAAGYSLYLFGATQWGYTVKTLHNLQLLTSREYLLMILHLTPAIYLIPMAQWLI